MAQKEHTAERRAIEAIEKKLLRYDKKGPQIWPCDLETSWSYIEEDDE